MLAPRKLKKRDSSKGSTLTIGQFLTPQIESARHSSLSMVEMAAQKEKPGVITPSRNPSLKLGLKQAIFSKKEKPPPPKARRSGFMRPKAQPALTELEVTRVGIPEKTITPEVDKNEAEKYEDAQEFQDQAQAQAQAQERVVEAEEVLSEAESQTDEQSKTFKKPPPAPKARRGWRMRKSRDGSEEDRDRNRDKEKEPGRFSTRMSSISTQTNPLPPVAEGLPDHSPFSAVPEKTLDPLTKNATIISPPNRTLEKRSVSTAMSQAQAQAEQEVEQCLEHTHLTDFHNSSPVQYTVLSHPSNPHITVESPSVPRTVLAPPGQAPIRSVPGPRLEVERSPFLTDDEISCGPDSTNPSRKPSDANEAVSVMTRRDSWEDFCD